MQRTRRGAVCDCPEAIVSRPFPNEIQTYPQGQARMQTFPKLLNPTNKVSIGIFAPICLLADRLVETKTKPKPAQASPSATPRSPAGRNPRTARKVGVQATRLEAVDDSLGPLGPLGENSNISEPEIPPAPPSKEQSLPVRNVRPQQPNQSPMSRSMIDSADLGDDERSSINSRQRYAAAGHPSTENVRRQTQPSVSIEQAARPSFNITVGDPHKVGDLTSSHIVYQVRTKVRSRECSRSPCSL